MVETTPPTTAQDQDVIMRIRDATVTFGMDAGVSKVLNEVDLDVRQGEILGVVGESGSGKSMFASALLDAVVNPGQLTGEIVFNRENGESVDVMNLSTRELKDYRWEEVSMVFQGAMSSFNPVMKLRGHFKETLKSHDYSVEQGMERARKLLSDLHLDPDRVLNSYAHELSGGMNQRALIALSLVLDPDILVMDEPTASLDLLMQRSIISLLYDIKEKHDLTLIFITHDLPLVAELADRIAVMYAFEFVELGPKEEIIADAAHPYTRALLAATPDIESSVDEMRPIEGSSPDPFDIPQGCSYEPRCPLAQEDCRMNDPAYQQVDDDHQAACFYWEEAADAVPVSIEEPKREGYDE